MKTLAIVFTIVLALMLAVGAVGCGEEEAATPGPSATAAPTVGPTATPTGVSENLRFLISDDANAIGDFEHLFVRISTIGMHRGGNETGEWLEVAPLVEEVDLKLLVEDNAQVIWSGSVEPGNYTKVFIYVSEAWGNLTAAKGNDTVGVKLPSGKLHLSRAFEVTEDSVTSFVYDLAVVAAGSDKSGVKYILKPQLGQSGADKKYEEVAL